MKIYAPVVLFVYNRLYHTQKTIEALLKNDLASESELIIFLDGPKSEVNISEVNEVRKYIKSISGFKNIIIIEKQENNGLAKSIISGVTEVVNKYEKIIVLEDDLVTSPFFLTYMNVALDMYENDEEVISIHGYNYPTEEKNFGTFFLRGADCWGWATWKRGWDIFESDGKKLIKTLKDLNLEYRFNFNGCADYVEMLKNQILGKNNSWAIRWHASAFINNKLTLYPGISLVNNIGFDNTGIHCEENGSIYFNNVLAEKIDLKRKELKEDEYFFNKRCEFFRLNKKSFFKKFLNKVKKLLKKIYNVCKH